MKLIDYLGDFSIEDLREMARRRGVRVSQDARVGRQTLLRTLAGALEQYGSVYSSVIRLNQAEAAVLWYLLHHKRAGQSAIAQAATAEAAVVRGVLESLRLWGLVFPEGDWEHIHIPPGTQAATGYVAAPKGSEPDTPLAGFVVPPELQTAPGVRCDPRPGTLSGDFAEALSRIARTRMKLTQARRINRRDLRNIEAALAIPLEGYGDFVYSLLVEAGFLLASGENILTVAETAEPWLAAPERTRALTYTEGWKQGHGYPESASGDPAEASYLPPQLGDQRARMLEIAAELDLETPVVVGSVAARLAWMVPMAFQQWNGNRDPSFVAARLARSLYWLGLVAVDDPDAPRHFRLTPLGRAVLIPDTAGEGLVPEEHCFFLQPNAEVFAPPNLSPWVLFHLRRLTGEKKGGPAGMYPLNAESVRRALDSGLTVTQVATFLERFSRTGLPANVKAMVETAGRQHGRIRLVPTEWVLVTDQPELMDELRNLKTIVAQMGEPLTERTALVADAAITPLMRQLRTRGYAPINQAEVGDTLPLPADPEKAPPPPAELVGSRNSTLTAGPEGAEDGVVPENVKVTGRRQIRELLELALEVGLSIEIDYLGDAQRKRATEVVYPVYVGPQEVIAETEDGEERTYRLAAILWARLVQDSEPVAESEPESDPESDPESVKEVE